MSRTSILIQAGLWAGAIAVAAAAGASAFFTLVLLPSLAGMALLLDAPRQACIAR